MKPGLYRTTGPWLDSHVWHFRNSRGKWYWWDATHTRWRMNGINDAHWEWGSPPRETNLEKSSPLEFLLTTGEPFEEPDPNEVWII